MARDKSDKQKLVNIFDFSSNGVNLSIFCVQFATSVHTSVHKEMLSSDNPVLLGFPGKSGLDTKNRGLGINKKIIK